MSDRFAVTEIAVLCSVDAYLNPCLRMAISQAVKPRSEGFRSLIPSISIGSVMGLMAGLKSVRPERGRIPKSLSDHAGEDPPQSPTDFEPTTVSLNNPQRFRPTDGRATSPVWGLVFAALVLAALLIEEAFAFRAGTFSNGWKDYAAYLMLPGHNWRFRGAAIAFMVIAMVQVFVGLYLVQGLEKPTRMITLSIAWLAASFEQAYLGTYGRFSTEADLAMAVTDTALKHWKTAIELYFEKRSLFCALLFLALVRAPRARRFRNLTLAAFGTLTIGFYSLAWKLDDRLFSFRPFATVSLAASQRSLTALILGRALTPPVERDPLPLFNGAGPKTNVVFIVDESVAGDRLSLNGHARPTTPFLDRLEQEKRLVNLGLAVAGTTCSHSSGNLLLTGLGPEEMPATERLQKTPSLFQFAHAAGYRTHFFDGQMTTFWLGTRVFWKGSFGDWRMVDDWRPAGQFEAPTRAGTDRRLARAIRETLDETPEGAFIWIWKAGAHVPYTSCYSPAAALWGAAADRLDEPVSLLNAYDNCLVEVVDGFFEELLKPPHPWLDHTVFVYTSDHGQTLSRGGLRYTHCGNSPLEVVVPLFVVGDAAAVKSVDVSWRNAAAHENIFPSLLDFMGVPASARPTRYAPSFLHERTGEPQRVFRGPDLDRGPATAFPENLISAFALTKGIQKNRD